MSYDDNELLDYLKEADSKVEGTITGPKFDSLNFGPCSSTISRRFESWNTAKRKAGLEEYDHTGKFSGKDNPSYKGKVTVRCDYCGKEKEVYPRTAKRNKTNFCNRECKNSYQSIEWTGEDSPAWKGGWYNYYGSDWNHKRLEVQERDNNICQHCGKDQVELGKRPDVHHIVPIRMFDNPNEAHKLDNMVQLCRTCHATYEKLNPMEQLRKLR